MKPVIDHSWDLSAAEARQLQGQLAQRVRLRDEPLRLPLLVGGCDAAGSGRWSKRTERLTAAALVYRFPSGELVDRAWVNRRSPFPYVPGLLSFREAPLYVEAFAQLRVRPDLLLCDGQGVAHPRRLGLASHLGILFDLPSIGVAKSRLVGSYRDPGSRRGCSTLLRDQGEVVGRVVRTRTQVRPLFISPGHRLGVEGATSWVLRLTAGFRLPEPTRMADIWVGKLHRGGSQEPPRGGIHWAKRAR
jgi:deoxyribonuclease V